MLMLEQIYVFSKYHQNNCLVMHQETTIEGMILRSDRCFQVELE